MPPSVDTAIQTLGPGRFPSPLDLNTVRGDRIGNFVSEKTRVRHQVEITPGVPVDDETFFEKAAAAEAVLRTAPDTCSPCHVRRPVPRPEQRHPLGLPRTAPQLRRARSTGHPPRLSGPDLPVRTAARADPGNGRSHPPRRRHNPVVIARTAIVAEWWII